MSKIFDEMHKGNLPLTTSAMGKVSFAQVINHTAYSRKIKLQNHLQNPLVPLGAICFLPFGKGAILFV